MPSRPPPPRIQSAPPTIGNTSPIDLFPSPNDSPVTVPSPTAPGSPVFEELVSPTRRQKYSVDFIMQFRYMSPSTPTTMNSAGTPFTPVTGPRSEVPYPPIATPLRFPSTPATGNGSAVFATPTPSTLKKYTSIPGTPTTPILNKITPQNYPSLFLQLADMGYAVQDPDCLERIAAEVIDRAVLQPIYCSMYADLCNDLMHFNASAIKDLPDFRRALMAKCDAEFALKRATDIDSLEEDKATKLKKKYVGLMQFVGHLHSKQLVTLKFVNDIIASAFSLPHPPEEDLEGVCVLLKTLIQLCPGAPEIEELLQIYRQAIVHMAENYSVSRLRFMFKELLEPINYTPSPCKVNRLENELPIDTQSAVKYFTAISQRPQAEQQSAACTQTLGLLESVFADGSNSCVQRLNTLMRKLAESRLVNLDPGVLLLHWLISRKESDRDEDFLAAAQKDLREAIPEKYRGSMLVCEKLYSAALIHLITKLNLIRACKGKKTFDELSAYFGRWIAPLISPWCKSIVPSVQQKMELTILNTTQRICWKLGFPNELINSVFQCLYQFEFAALRAMTVWRAQKECPEGKLQAISQVDGFLQYLLSD